MRDVAKRPLYEPLLLPLPLLLLLLLPLPLLSPLLVFRRHPRPCKVNAPILAVTLASHPHHPNPKTKDPGTNPSSPRL